MAAAHVALGNDNRATVHLVARHLRPLMHVSRLEDRVLTHGRAGPLTVRVPDFIEREHEKGYGDDKDRQFNWRRGYGSVQDPLTSVLPPGVRSASL